MKRVLVVQMATTLLISAVIIGLHYLIPQEKVELALAYKIKASLFSSILVMLGTVLAARSSARVGVVREGAGQTTVTLAPILIGMVNRLIVMGGGLGFGLVILKLPPMYIILSFLIVQLSQIWVAMRDN